jgi:hypothetical protein
VGSPSSVARSRIASVSSSSLATSASATSPCSWNRDPESSALSACSSSAVTLLFLREGLKGEQCPVPWIGLVGARQQAPDRADVALTGLLRQQLEQLILRRDVDRADLGPLERRGDQPAHENRPGDPVLGGEGVEALESAIGDPYRHPGHA